jgi:hypothetical protein
MAMEQVDSDKQQCGGVKPVYFKLRLFTDY